jgi:uncharacterized protein (TIRG00374 family)
LERRNIWQQVKGWLPGVLISAVALYLVLRLVNVREIGPALERIKPIYIIAATLLTLLFLYLRGIAWRVILGGKVTIMQSFWAINQGYMLNNLFPLRAGELGRALLLGQAANINPVQILSSIVIERSFDLAIAASMLLITLPLALGMAWARSVAIVTLLVIIAMLVVLFLMTRNQVFFARLIENLGKHWKFIQKYVAPQVNALLEGFSTLSNPRQFLLSLGMIALSWGVAITEYYVFILAIVPVAPFWWGVFTDAVLALGIAIPSAPAALGTFEAAIVGALTVLGIQQTPALAYAITIHFIQFVVTGILGMAGLLKQGRSLGNLFRELRVRRKSNTLD